MDRKLKLDKLMAQSGTSGAVGEILREPSQFVEGFVPIPLLVLQDEVEF